MLQIDKLINKPITSCCYIVSDKEINNNCIIIDPGSESNDVLYEKLDTFQLTPEYIMLTHEHFDHCWGVNRLRKRYSNIKLLCSKECNDAIQKEKGNCSVFYDNQRAFKLNPADIITQNVGNLLHWNSHMVKFIPTPGHSSASISIIIGNVIFTGDALIPDMKAVVKLPTGNVKNQIITEDFFRSLTNFYFYPGHGEPFNDVSHIIPCNS